MDVFIFVLACLLSVCAVAALMDAIVFDSKYLNQFLAYLREKLSTKPAQVQKRKEKILTKIAEKGISVIKPSPEDSPQKKKLPPVKLTKKDRPAMEEKIIEILNNTPDYKKHSKAIEGHYDQKTFGEFFENENAFFVGDCYFKFKREGTSWKSIQES